MNEAGVACVMLELDHIFPQITLTLNAERAALLVDKIPLKPGGNRTGSADHGIKGRNTVQRPRQAHEQADPPKTVVAQAAKIK